ncbi:MAG: apolipoprotein N-acyltransferase [Pseudobdellovibrionaceae bacterium]
MKTFSISKLKKSLGLILRNHRFGIFTGLMVGTSYIPFPPWAIFFCYMPLMFVFLNPENNLKRVFWNGWWSQFTLSMIGFHWIYHVATEFGHLPPALSLLILFLFSSLVHLYIPLTCVAVHFAQNKFSLSRFQTFLTFALTLSLAERIWPGIFDWHLGYTLLWIKSPVTQWADVIGFEGISTLLLLTQASLLEFFLRYKERQPLLRTSPLLLAPLLIWGLLHFTGLNKRTEWSASDRTLSVAPIQANIGNLEKIQSEQGSGYEYKVIQRHFELMKIAQQKNPLLDLYIWPETAFPDLLDEQFLQFNRQQFLLQQLKLYPSPILLGGYSRQKFPPRKPGLEPQVKNYNALFLFDQNQNLISFYRKTELLIFGEYIPLSETFPILLDWFPFIAGFGRGPGPTTLALNPRANPNEVVLLGAQICYEGLNPKFTRKLSEKGAQVLINLTNDSWFGKYFEPHQHLMMTLARAIEVRRPLVRSTNTGITVVIQADGTIEQQSPLHLPWTDIFDVRYQTAAKQTVYVKYGHLDWVLLSLLLIGILGSSLIRTRSKEK